MVENTLYLLYNHDSYNIYLFNIHSYNLNTKISGVNPSLLLSISDIVLEFYLFYELLCEFLAFKLNKAPFISLVIYIYM